MANFSFTNSGALPQSMTTPTASVKSPFTAQSPVTSALNFAQSSSFQPAGAVKKTVTTDSSGNTHETHYDTSATSAPKTGTQKGVLSSAPVNNDGSQASQSNPNYGLMTQGLGAAGSSTAPTGNTGIPSPTTTDPSTISIDTSKLPQSPGDSPTSLSGIASGLINAGSNTQVRQNQIADKISQLKQNLQTDTGVIQGQPQELNFQTGRVNALQTQEAGKEAALQGELANEIAAGGQKIGALNSAGGLISPRQNGYVLIDPKTGQPVGGNGTSAINQGGQMDAQYQGALANATDNQAITGAQSNIDSITQLINKGNLNPSKVNLGNATIQEIQKNLSSSDYATLNNTLGAINAALTKVTGSPVDISQLSTQNGTSLLTTINNAVATAKAIAAGKLSGNNTQSNGTNTTTTNSGGLYSF